MSKFERNAVTWFEIPTVNIERATSYYEAVLGMTLRPWPGAEPCRMFPVGESGVGGCLVERAAHRPAADGTLVYLNVDGKLDQVLERAQQNGGKLLVPRTAIEGGFGFYAVITDSEGNQIGLHSR
uniref:VOC family protein n=1 Tax=Acidobacterium capsulatum TaxID=33075 RepID=A0A7V4XS46_9BACT